MRVVRAGRGSNKARVYNAPRTVFLKARGMRRHPLPSQIFPDMDLCEAMDELRLVRMQLQERNLTVQQLRGELTQLEGVRILFKNAEQRIADTVAVNEELRVKTEQRGNADVDRWRLAYMKQRNACAELRIVVAQASSHSRELHAETTSQSKQLAQYASRVEHLKSTRSTLKAQVHDLDSVLKAVTRDLHAGRLSAEARAEECSTLSAQVQELEASLGEESVTCADATARATELADALKKSTEKKRGRVAGHRGHAELQASWDGMTHGARQVAMWRHTNEITDKLKEGGISDWAPAALAKALTKFELVKDLMSTRPFCDEKMMLVYDLSKILKAEWGAELSLFCRNDVELSLSQYQKLRLALGKQYGASGWEKKLWYKCPVTGKQVWCPFPPASGHYRSLFRNYGWSLGMKFHRN